MSKRSTTHVTFNVHFDIPQGSNITEARQFIKDAINCEARAREVDDIYAVMAEIPVTVQLVKKEVTYA